MRVLSETFELSLRRAYIANRSGQLEAGSWAKRGLRARFAACA